MLGDASAMTDNVIGNKDVRQVGWFLGRAKKRINNSEFTNKIRNTLLVFRDRLDQQAAETPYGVMGGDLHITCFWYWQLNNY